MTRASQDVAKPPNARQEPELAARVDLEQSDVEVDVEPLRRPLDASAGKRCELVERLRHRRRLSDHESEQVRSPQTGEHGGLPPQADARHERARSIRDAIPA